MAGGCTRKVGLIEATQLEFSRIELEKPVHSDAGFAHYSIIRTNASRSGIHYRRKKCPILGEARLTGPAMLVLHCGPHGKDIAGGKVDKGAQAVAAGMVPQLA
jgi:hypothetical protein